MNKVNFKINIDAPRSTIWEVLWEDNTYRKWTSVFGEGSNVVSDWKEGSKVLFLDGKEDGMFSEIERIVPQRLISFKHLGVVKNGKEQPQDKDSKEWAGAMENYELNDKDGHTELIVHVDIIEEFSDFMKDKFPKALDKVKELAEAA